ncbi:MAG: bactofilin family protein, partial [Candidatus Binatia bacterium]
MGLFGRDEKDPKDLAKDPSKDFTKDFARDNRTLPPVSDAKLQPATQTLPAAAKEPKMVEKERVESGDLAEVQAYLGKGSRVSGKLTFDGTVRVDGQVEGEIAAQDTLIVGERAVVTAQITGNTIVIKGRVTGDINARKRVEVRAPGKLYGNIVTPSLVIHEGVIFEGHCSMGGAETLVADS